MLERKDDEHWRKPLYHHLYFQVVCAIVIGIMLGHFYPALAVKMKPLGEAFIKAIKMLIAPIIFCTVVHGIASMNDMKKVGRVGLKAIVYFEVVTTLALIVGLIVVNLWQPGSRDECRCRAPSTPNRSSSYTTQAQIAELPSTICSHIIPATVVGAFAEGEILQVLFFSILFAFALHMAGDRGKPVLSDDRYAPRTCSSASSGSSCGRPRSAPLARWPSRSANTASASLFSLGRADGLRSTPPA